MYGISYGSTQAIDTVTVRKTISYHIRRRTVSVAEVGSTDDPTERLGSPRLPYKSTDIRLYRL